MRPVRALLLLLLPIVSTAQTAPPIESLLANLQPRQLGPTTMGGRISDIAVYETEPRIFYVASSSGGVWKTENGGMSFSVVFEKGATSSLGAVAVCQSNPNIVYVGMGEPSSRNSVGWGDGVYKTVDGGKSWQHLGLEATRVISKIVIDPRNPDVVYIAALGNLWSPNPERGVYKTTDGGKHWVQALKVDHRTGAVDIAINPRNPNDLLVAMWERLRKPYDFSSGGPTSGIYRSTNAGQKWHKVIRGLPANGSFGRIGLSYFRKDPRVVIASVEFQANQRSTTSGALPSFSGGGVFRSNDGGESWSRISSLNPRPFYFSLPRQDPNDPNRVYLPAIGLHYSDDAGRTFKSMRLSVHVDFHAMWIDPADSNHIIVGNDGGVSQSRDRGLTWEHLNGMPIGQFYAIAFDYRKPYWIYGGLQDNGSWAIPTQSTRGGPAFWDAINVAGGDGFYVAVDPSDPNTVYAESQGGAAMRVDLRTGSQRFIRPRPPQGETYRFNWSTPFIISPHNPRTLYLGGNRLFKSVDRGDSWTPISMDLTTNNKSRLSPGKMSVTPEDTGAETHCSVVTISESPMKPGVLYVGTDDGLVQGSQDDGKTWTNLTPSIPNLPMGTWCSRVLASKWVASRVYATFDGHRGNDFLPYVYFSEDFGKTWSKLNSGLPENDCIYVICEGEKNPNLLFLGSETSLRISLDRGKRWFRYAGSNPTTPANTQTSGRFFDGSSPSIAIPFPTVAVHDLAVHPRESDLVVGTHGRSIWTIDIGGLEGLTEETLKAEAAVFPPQSVLRLGLVSNLSWAGDRTWQSANTQPGTSVFFYLRTEAKDDPKIVISDAAAKSSQELTGSKQAGLNVIRWNGRFGGRLAEPGDYRITLKVGSNEYITSVRVENADRYGIGGGDG